MGGAGTDPAQETVLRIYPRTQHEAVFTFGKPPVTSKMQQSCRRCSTIFLIYERQF